MWRDKVFRWNFIDFEFHLQFFMLVTAVHLFILKIVHSLVLFLKGGQVWVESGDELLVVALVWCTYGHFSDLVDAVRYEFEEISR